MDLELTEEQVALRQTIREFAEAEIKPRAAELDQKEEFPLDIIRQLAALGIMGLPFPQEYGGLGAGSLEMCIVIEELARVDSSVAITVAANVSLGGAPLLLFGSEDQKQRWLVPLARGEILGAFGSTEPGCGSDMRAISTIARLRDGKWVINGTKAFITNAGTPISGFVVITAVTGHHDGEKEVSNIIVPSGTPGYQVGRPYRKLGWHASDTRELVFTDCQVPESNLLGRRGKGLSQFMAVLDGGRIGVAAMAVGLAQGCLEMSLQYTRERTAFGRPVASNQSVQFMLADMATEIEAARWLTYRAAYLKDSGKPFSREAAMAKLFASELAVRASGTAVQLHGGYGFMEECAAARFYRDARILTIGEGTSEVQKMVIARSLGMGA